MGLPQGWLFQLSLFLVTSSATAARQEIDYIPVLTKKSLEGRITSSTFTLDQPSGQFNSSIISDIDDIWLVVAFSNATENFVAPQSPEDIPDAETFLEKKYYMTLRAHQSLYSSQTNAQSLYVLRVGNEVNCIMNECNKPLPGPGPYRVKFLVMDNNGTVAETKWSEDITLNKPVKFSESHGPGKSLGTLFIVVILSILLILLFLALVILLIYSCFGICGTRNISRPQESFQVQKYNAHPAYDSWDNEIS